MRWVDVIILGKEPLKIGKYGKNTGRPTSVNGSMKAERKNNNRKTSQEISYVSD